MRPITDILIEFPRALPPGLVVESTPGETAEALAFDENEAVALALAAAHEAGVDEGRAMAEAAWADRLAAHAAEREREQEEARARWAAEEGALMAERLLAGLAALEDALARGLASAFPAFIQPLVRRRAAAELCEAVATLLAGDQGALLRVSGPADLVAPVRQAFEGHAGLSVVETEAADVCLTLGDTLIATQVAAWQARLQAVLEEGL